MELKYTAEKVIGHPNKYLTLVLDTYPTEI